MPLQKSDLQLKGKIISGVIGLFLGDLSGAPFGGLVGFFVGAAFGHFTFDRPRELAAQRQFQAYQRRKGHFVEYVFILCAKMAKADGAVNRLEINVMERLMRNQFRLNDRARAEAVKVWRTAKDSNVSYETAAQNFFNQFSKERNRVLDMMHLLFEIAAADGNLHPAEEQLLLRTAAIFHISRTQYERIKGRFYHVASQKWMPTDPYYAILGVEPTDSKEVIKKKYRELVKKWHPDRLNASGASPEAMRHAKEKMQQITEAYEKIMAG